MNRIFWDSMLFIYLFEQHPQHGPDVLRMAERIRARGDRIVTSALAAAEVLVGMEKIGNLAMIDAYRSYFESEEISVIPFDLAAIPIFARLRAKQRIAAPDAIHLACAARQQVAVALPVEQVDARQAGIVSTGITVNPHRLPGRRGSAVSPPGRQFALGPQRKGSGSRSQDHSP